MVIEVDQLVTMLLTSAVELGGEIAHAKNRDSARYLEGSRDTLRALAKAFKQSCPLAVELFQTPVEVKDGH